MKTFLNQLDILTLEKMEQISGLEAQNNLWKYKTGYSLISIPKDWGECDYFYA